MFLYISFDYILKKLIVWYQDDIFFFKVYANYSEFDNLFIKTSCTAPK